MVAKTGVQLGSNIIINDNIRTTHVSRTHNCKPTSAHPVCVFMYICGCALHTHPHTYEYVCTSGFSSLILLMKIRGRSPCLPGTLTVA